MKYLFILPLFFVCDSVLAQVPGRKGTDVDVRGDIISEPVLGSSPSQIAGYYQKDGKYGFVDLQGIKQAAIYKKITSTSTGFIVQKDDLYGIADKKGQLIGNIGYDSVGTSYETAFYIVKKKGKYGTISGEGNKILSLKYDNIVAANNFVSFVRTSKGQVQLIFNDEEKAFPEQIQSAMLYSNLVIIKANGKFGVVKKQLIVPLSYDSIFVSSTQNNSVISRGKQPVKKYLPIDKSNSYRVISLLTLQNGNKYGLADNDGTIIYPVDNDAIYNQELYKYYTVKKGKLFGIYFINNKKKTDIEFDKVYSDGLGYAMAVKNQKGGVFDLQGNQLVAFDYDPEFMMQYRMGFRVTKNKKRGIVGKKGEVLIPPVYDDVDPFFESGLSNFVKVKSGEKFGIVNLEGKTIIPVEFTWIGEEKGLLKVVTADKLMGLYDKTGKVIIPADYRWIIDSDTEDSNIIVLTKPDNTYNFLNKKTMQMLLPESMSDYGYVIDQDGLVNPFYSSGKALSFVKNKIGKIGLLNEITGSLNVPIIYDDIIQRFDADKHIYFSVRKGKKYGLIDEANNPVIALEYDAISIDMMSYADHSVIVAKGKKFGTVGLDNKQLIPFQYDDLQRVSHTGLFKAKIGAVYKVINVKNEVINNGPFDEVANFENTGRYGDQALTFYKGKMRVIDEKGRFVTAEVAMLPHKGYKTFDELKWALVKALDSNDEALLKDFAAKAAPSEHLLYYLKENMFTKQSLQYTNVNSIRDKYYRDLRKFKVRKWNDTTDFGYKHTSLTAMKDYTLTRQGFVTNARRSDPAFGDTRFMEKVLRDAIKVNGYWISTYFMQSSFDTFEP